MVVPLQALLLRTKKLSQPEMLRSYSKSALKIILFLMSEGVSARSSEARVPVLPHGPDDEIVSRLQVLAASSMACTCSGSR